MTKDQSVKTYIIHTTDYMGKEPTMSEFKGPWRQLLEHLNGVTEENREDEFGDENMTIKDFDNEALQHIFDQANGDGQPYYTVWCVEEHRKVLG